MLEFIYGIIIGITQYFNVRLLKKFHKLRIPLVSFAAGLSSSYLFLLLLPETFNGFQILKNYIFLTLFIGYVSIHISEKYIYKYVDKKRINQGVRTIHHATFFLYHFIIGIILVTFLKQSIRQGTLFFIPIWFHTTVSSIALTEIHHKHIRERTITKILLSFSTILGVALAVLIMIPTIIYYILLALITGALTYIIIKDLTPKGKEGNLNMFILGVIAYSLIIILTRLIF